MWFTSRRLRGEVAALLRAAGEGDSPRNSARGDSSSPQPSPRKRGEGAHFWVRLQLNLNSPPWASRQRRGPAFVEDRRFPRDLRSRGVGCGQADAACFHLAPEIGNGFLEPAAKL